MEREREDRPFGKEIPEGVVQGLFAEDRSRLREWRGSDIYLNVLVRETRDCKEEQKIC